MNDKTKEVSRFLNGADVRGVKVKQLGPFIFIDQETRTASGLIAKHKIFGIHIVNWSISLTIARCL
jgi:hypothetical protein